MNLKIEKVIERIDLKIIGIGFLVWVVFFALLYYLISRHSISSTLSVESISFFDALFYSFVTVTTLGTSEYSPTGWLKLLTVFEVLGGILAAGLVVNLILSIPSRRTRNAIKFSTGWWLEQINLPRDRRFYSFTVIMQEDDILKKIGFNFDEFGRMDETFYEGKMVSSLFPTLLSIYHNDSNSKDYTEGVLKIELQKTPDNLYHIYTGSTYDKKYGKRDSLVGKRILDDLIIEKLNDRSITKEEKKALIENLFGT